MVSRDRLRDLLLHMEWADAAVWAAVPDVEVPDERLRQTLVHIHTVQRAFLCIWQGRSPSEAFRPAADFARLSDVRDWARPYYAEALAFVDGLSDEALALAVVMPWAAQIAERLGHQPDRTTLADTGFQVASHSTYHRGQVNARLRDIGAEPPLVDYIAWIWLGRPAPAWTR